MSEEAAGDGHDPKITLACVQMEPRIGDPTGNIERSCAKIEEAAAAGAGLVVLPELANSGYVFERREEAYAHAETAGDGPASLAWAELARRHGLYIVAGLAERDGAALYNSAAVIGPEGHIGTYRKMHLWNEENLYFEPGNLGFPVFQTPIGRIGCLICYDIWFPEAFRLLALQGADLVCVPTNWVPVPGQTPERRAMANVLCMGAAHSNSLFVAAADRVGTERGQPFIGQSLICDVTGWPLAGPASRDQEEILTAAVDLADARRKRNWNTFNQPLRDRRVDVYDTVLGADVRPGWF
ncbi:nitrilase family protein [Algihabitans albus]|uniref:nitrilase family protein n=1 Tax=Algihabitans albus TaxID=2164067 RepID=UPI000E5D83DE|nr:nitrilase family protein [Algihabitans albus]